MDARPAIIRHREPIPVKGAWTQVTGRPTGSVVTADLGCASPVAAQGPDGLCRADDGFVCTAIA